MTVQAAKFTPEVMISAPRRGPGIPNPSGTSVLYTCSTYSFETHSKTEEIRLLDVETKETTVLSGNSSHQEPTWVGDHELVLLDTSARDEDVTSLLYWDISNGSEPEVVHRINGLVSNLKPKRISDDEIAIACTSEVNPDGAMHQPHKEPKPHSSARVYSDLYVRHWDAWKGKARNTIWYGLLRKEGGKYGLQGAGLVNALSGTKLESPVPPFCSASDFDISASGVVFVARDPTLNPAYYTKTDLYFVPLSSFSLSSPPAPRVAETDGLSGYSDSPRFSHDGKKVVFARMRDVQYEADKLRLMLIPDVDEWGRAEEFYKTEDGEGGWDASPAGVDWSRDDSELYVLAEKHGKKALWRLPSSPARASALPVYIDTTNSVAHAANIPGPGRRLLITSSSFIESSCYSILDPSIGEETVLSSATKNGKTLGLSPAQASEFWYTGCDGRQVHALVLKPSTFDPAKRYPLAFLVHGGPQGMWSNVWHTRWNAAVFAEQGYVAVMPNPTGSTGYGQEFTDRIQKEWGGRPYVDLEKCWEHIRDTMPYVDVENGVALGASYGGYMMNWIQGHPLGRKFKALICHDGSFSTANQWATEELFFPIRDFGGTLWEKREYYDKWDPSRFTDQWATPMLVVHNELDYRLPVSEGLAMFNVLQARGIPSRFVMFPDENHWTLKPENSLVWHREIIDFINKHSGVDGGSSESVPGVDTLKI